MRTILKILIIIGLVQPMWSQPIIDSSPVGRIVIDGRVAGTGFVCGHPRIVLTCTHVITNNEVQFLHQGKFIDLKLIRADSVLDLAVLVSSDSIYSKPYRAISKGGNLVGDTIYYIGHDMSLNRIGSLDSIELDLVKGGGLITSYGIQSNNSGIAKFIEFEGRAKPGCSGGPVFNAEGFVIGVLTQAWDKLSLQEGTRVITRINRAFIFSDAKFH